MQVIVSRELEPGCFAEVGMNDRTIIGPWKQEWRIMRLARSFARGGKARLEWFADGTISHGKPVRTTFI